MGGTPFSFIYKVFLSKITDDMYMELTQEDTLALLQELLFSAIHKFEFPRQSLNYVKITQIEEETEETQEQEQTENEEDNDELKDDTMVFVNTLTNEQINILATYMIVEWLGQQLASVENVRMKYSGSDFKFTSQANHMQKLLQMKKDYEREGFHLQRLYKRRKQNEEGIYESTMGNLMSYQPRGGSGQWKKWL